MRVALLTAPIVVSISLVCYYFAYAYDVGWALWLGAVAAFMLVVLGVTRDQGEINRLSIAVAFMISLRLLFIFRTEWWGFPIDHMTDSSFDLQLASLIYEQEKWTVGMGFERAVPYSYYPALYLWSVILSKVSTVDLVMIARVFPVMTEGLITVLFYLALRSVLSKEEAIWGSIIYNLNGNLQFWEQYVRELFALVFYAFCLYVIFRTFRKTNAYRQFFLLGVVGIIIVAISHHWTSYNLVLILFVLVVLPPLYGRFSWHLFGRRSSDHRRLGWSIFPVIASVIILAYSIYLAFYTFGSHVTMLSKFFSNLIASQGFVPHPLTGMSLYEKVLEYFGWVVLGGFGMLELVRGLSIKRPSRERLLLESWFLFSGIYMIVSTFLLPSGGGVDWRVISERSWSFAFFGLAPMVAISIRRIGSARQRWIKHLAPYMLVFVLVSAFLNAPYEVRYPAYPIVDDSYYFAAQWIRPNVQENLTMSIDRWSYVVIVPYSRLNVISGSMEGQAGNFIHLRASVVNQKGVHLPSHELQIAVINKRISEWLPTMTGDPSAPYQTGDRIYDSNSVALYLAI